MQLGTPLGADHALIIGELDEGPWWWGQLAGTGAATAELTAAELDDGGADDELTLAFRSATASYDSQSGRRLQVEFPALMRRRRAR